MQSGRGDRNRRVPVNGRGSGRGSIAPAVVIAALIVVAAAGRVAGGRGFVGDLGCSARVAQGAEGGEEKDEDGMQEPGGYGFRSGGSSHCCRRYDGSITVFRLEGG